MFSTSLVVGLMALVSSAFAASTVAPEIRYHVVYLNNKALTERVTFEAFKPLIIPPGGAEVKVCSGMTEPGDVESLYGTVTQVLYQTIERENVIMNYARVQLEPLPPDQQVDCPPDGKAALINTPG